MNYSLFTSKSNLVISLLIFSLMTAMIVESSQPPLPLLSLMDGFDKIAHFSAFSCLGLLICALSFKLSSKEKIGLFSMPLLISTAFGVIEESYQTLIPTRTSSIYDLIADILGAMFAIIISNQIARLIRKRSNISTE